MEYKLNGKTYQLSNEISFVEMAQLEKCGITLQALKEPENLPFNILLGAVAFITKLSLQEANDEMMIHLKNGGKLGDFQEAIKMLFEVLKNSDFFKLAGITN